ncbi:MAG TPA: Rrf2 family transcriptional regulator [Kiritimatiellia bacterium]|nr:Rrf2 family transcriptional regulator [Kiritimatiellia bacterium]
MSKKVEYGLMALILIEAASPDVVSSKELAEKHELPVDLLGKVMQAMAKAGLIDSVHGARGGYRAVRSLDRISLGEVIDAVDGPVRLVRCQHDQHDCVQFPSCRLKEPIQRLHDQLQQFLYSVAVGEFRPNATPASAMARSL